MLETIESHVLDILQADPRTWAGGNAYPNGWLGAKRPDADDAPTPGYVNLFDRPHEMGTLLSTPTITLGVKGMEAIDELEYPVCSAGGRVQMRIVALPLVISVLDTGGGLAAAKRQRNQLRGNVMRVLLGRCIEAGYWYEMTLTDRRSPLKNKVWATASGQGPQGASEAMAIVALQIRYSFNASSPS